MTKINKLHFNWVDYDIGDKDIHDLTEKSTLAESDEFMIADSEDGNVHKKVKASNILWYDNWVCSETIQKWDVVSIKRYDVLDATLTQQNVWYDTNSAKLAIKIYGSWISSNKLYINVWKNSSWQDLVVRVETDNNWVPSGTLVNNDATATISANDLQTTLTYTEIQLGWDVLLEKWTIYWIVFSCSSTSTTNYDFVWVWKSGASKSYIYNGNNWDDLQQAGTTTTENMKATWTGWRVSETDFTITVKNNIFLYSLSWLLSSTSNFYKRVKLYEDWNLIKEVTRTAYNADFNINYILETGKSYRFFIDDGSWYGSDASWYMEFPNFIDTITNISWLWYNTQYQTNAVIFNFAYVVDYTINWKSNMWYNLIQKVDTNSIYTFDDIIGVAIADKNEWEMWNIAVNGGTITNDNRDLIIWQDYFFVNNTISDTPIASANIICLWKAINKTAIKVDIKKALYSLSSDIAPFTWLNSGVPVYKGETVTGSLIAWF